MYSRESKHLSSSLLGLVPGDYKLNQKKERLTGEGKEFIHAMHTHAGECSDE